mgnify:CR=1 FL=1
MMNHGKSMKMTVLSLASAVAVLGMSSCLMGPDYKEPEMEVPAAFRGAPSMKESIASLPWWDVMRDPDLRDLLLDTYRNNRSLKATLANVDSARQNVTVTQAPLFPWASYGGSVSKGANQTGGSTIVNSGGITTAPGSMAASASWELDVWGRTRRAVEAAEADYFSAEHQLRALQLSLLRQVSTGYLQLLMLDEQLRVQKASVESYRKSLEYFEYRFKYDADSVLSVDSSRAALAAAEAQIPAIEYQIVELENTLSVLAGRTPGHIRRRGSLSDYAGGSTVPAGIPADILAHRPDVLAAEQQVRAANAEIGVAIANYFPSISLTAAAGVASSDLTTAVRKGTGWGMGANLSGPLFQAGQLRASEKIARNNLVAAVASYEETVLTALSEVSTTLVQRAKLRTILERQEAAVVSYRRYLDACLERVKTGYSDYYEVLTAQQNLFPAEQKLAEYRYQYAACIPTLYTQLGGGWNRSSESMREGRDDAPAQAKQ